MPVEGGWVPAWRALFDPHHDLAPDKRAPASKIHAWLDLCQMAAHEPYEHRGEPLRRGEFMAALRFLGRRWAWSKSRVERFMSDLEAMTRIGTVRGTDRGTVYRIVNYDTYAVVGDTYRDTGRDADRDRSGTAAGQIQPLNHSTITTNPPSRAREGRADVENSGTPEPDNLSDWLNGHAELLDGFPLYRDRRLRETLFQHYGPPGMRANAWRRPDGTSVPPEDRPRIFAVAASGYGAEGKRQLVPSEFAGVIRATVRAEVDEPGSAGPDQGYRPLTDDEFARWDARKHQLIDGGMDPEAAAEQADREVRGGEEAA